MNNASFWKKSLLGLVALVAAATLFSGCHSWHNYGHGGGHHGDHYSRGH